METGICLAGGGALLQALDQRVEEEARIRVWVAEDPMSCVARGAGMILEKYDALRHLLVGLERGSTRHN
jgi:rod shape-determining protein MreB